MLCNYTSQSTPNDLKQRLMDLNIPIENADTSEIIDLNARSIIINQAIDNLELPKELKRKKREIITNLIILRLIISDEIKVKLKSNNENILETSFKNLTRFGKILKIASFFTLMFIFEIPAFVIAGFPEEYMIFENTRYLQDSRTAKELNDYMTTFFKKRYKVDGSYDYFMEFAARNDTDASIRYATSIKEFITTNDRLPTPDEQNTMIEQINLLYPKIPTYSTPYRPSSWTQYKLEKKFWGDRNIWDADNFYSKFFKLAGIHGPILAVKSILMGTAVYSAVPAALLLYKLHKIMKQNLSESAKQEVSDFIDVFLLEFPVARQVMTDKEFIESFNKDSILNYHIQLYIREYLYKLHDKRRQKLSQENRNAENAEIAEKLAKAEKNAEDAKKKAKAEIEMFQDSIINTNTTTNETATKGNNKTVTNETSNKKNTWPNAISFANFTKPANANANPKGGRRSYRQKRRSATKRRKTYRKN